MVTRRHGPCLRTKAALIAIAWLGAVDVSAQGATENEIEAAYLFNFARFVEWPEQAFGGPLDPFVIGVIGDAAMADALREIASGRRVRERPVVVEELRSVSRARVHILYVGSSETFAWPRMLRQLEDKPMLTVGDMENFASRGGMVGFVLEQQRVRFEVNLERVEAAELNVSSHVLRLAKDIFPK
jgi:hypothetical protein